MGKEISGIYIIARADASISKYDEHGNYSPVVNLGSMFLGRIGYYDETTQRWDTGDLTILAKYDGDGTEIRNYQSNVPVTLTNLCICNFYDATLSHINVFTEPAYTLDCILSIFKDMVREEVFRARRCAVEYKDDDEEDETSDESETIDE